MVIISKSIIRSFSLKYPDAAIALQKWYQETKKAAWSSFPQIKKTFNTVDFVGNNRFVFDIKGNQYRLIALIIFRTGTVFILFIGTHKEYDKLDASKVTFTKNNL